MPETKEYCFHDPVPVIQNAHPNIESAADCIELQRNSFDGRHVIATRDIRVGEIIMVEKAYSSVVKRPLRMFYCSDCMNLCFGGIPCDKCAMAFYCSDYCKFKALEKYHRYECEVICNTPYATIQDPRDALTLRLAIQGILEFKSLREQKTNDLYRSDKYREIHELCTNRETMTKRQKIRGAIWPAIFYKALVEHTDALRHLPSKDAEYILKEFLLHTHSVVHSNAIFVDRYNNNQPKKKTVIGAALYSFGSMFNHSCSENIATCFYGRHAVLYAQRNIKKGEQCYVNYGRAFKINTALSPQKRLFTHHFNCQCQPCVQRWPHPSSLRSCGIYPVIPVIELLEEYFFKGLLNEHLRHNLLRYCCELLNTNKFVIHEFEWGLNRVILKSLIKNCLRTFGNRDVAF